MFLRKLQPGFTARRFPPTLVKKLTVYFPSSSTSTQSLVQSQATFHSPYSNSPRVAEVTLFLKLLSLPVRPLLSFPRDVDVIFQDHSHLFHPKLQALPLTVLALYSIRVYLAAIPAFHSPMDMGSIFFKPKVHQISNPSNPNLL